MKKKLADKILTNSEKKYRTIFDNAPIGKAREIKYKTFFDNSLDAIMITSQEGKIYAANPAACNMLDYTEKEICRLGRSVIVEQTNELLEGLWIRKNTGVFLGELTFIRKGGIRFPVEISSSVFTDSDGRELTTIIARDITDRKRTEKALKESEERLKLASKATGFGTYSYDFKTGKAYYSPEFLSLYGLSAHDTLKLDSDLVSEAVYPEDKPLFIHAMNQANKPGGTGILDLEFRIILPDGNIRWLRVRGQTLFSGSGDKADLQMANGIIQDITDSKMYEVALVESKTLLTSIIDSTNDLIWSVSPDEFRLLTFNRALETFFKKEAIKIREGMLLKEILPEGLVRKLEDLYSRTLKEGSLSVEYKTTLGNRILWINMNLLSRDKKAYAISVFAKDITEQRITEEKIRNASLYARTLIEASMDPLVTINADGKIGDVNFATEHITGIKRDKLIGSDFADYFSNPENARKGYKTVFLKGVVKDYPLTILHKSGKEIEVLYNATIYKNEAGEVQGVFAAARDIMDIKKMESDLLSSKSLLEKLNQHLQEVRENERSQIALNLHDDLGQRLTALFLDMAWLKSRIGVQSQAVREKMEDMSQLINETIEGIKEISSFLRPAILYDLGLIAAITSLLNKFENQSGIKCYFYYSPEEYIYKERISLILYRIIQESLTNIARHSKASSLEVRLNLLNGLIKLSVKDNGVGIDNEKVNSITSLGIAGIRERVRSVNGRVSVKGKKGIGTLLNISIPINNKSNND